MKRLFLNRIGPDILATHWMLYHKPLMRWLCNKLFVSFGEGSEFRPGAYAIECNRISIGKNIVIRPGTQLFGNSNIIICDNVIMGAGVHIYTSNHRFDDINTPIIHQGYKDGKEVILMEGCWIGACSIILPGITIGKNSVVGAGSIVTKSVPDRVVVVGNPARIIKTLGNKWY